MPAGLSIDGKYIFSIAKVSHDHACRNPRDTLFALVVWVNVVSLARAKILPEGIRPTKNSPNEAIL